MSRSKQIVTRLGNIPWLSDLPSHWKVVRSKRLFAVRKERARPDDEQLSATQAYGVIAQSEFERRVGRKVVRITQHLDKRAHVEKDDFVISMRSFQGGLERAWARGCIRSSYVVLQPAPEVHISYFAHLFKSHDYIRALQATSNFIRDGQDLSFRNFSLVDLPLPPLDEQVAIGRYLDHADRRIRRYIRAKRQLIALLNEQKQAIIHRAVTRGLDPHVKLKPSGVEWLGDVPEHWEVSRLKRLLHRIDQGVSPQSEARLASGGAWGVLKSGCVNHGVFRETEHKRLPDGFMIDEQLMVSAGDVLVSRACGSPKLVGSAGKVQYLNYRLILSDKTFRLVFKEPQLSDFAVAAMNSRYFRFQVERAISGAEGLANNLPLTSLRDILLVCPPTAEAVQIARSLSDRLDRLSALVGFTEREVETMQEFRTRLIADVVTGKLDVREAAVAPSDELDAVEPDAEELLDEDETTDDAELNAEPEEIEA